MSELSHIMTFCNFCPDEASIETLNCYIRLARGNINKLDVIYHMSLRYYLLGRQSFSSVSMGTNAEKCAAS